MTVGCPSNGRRASSISALPAPAAQTSAGGTACSLLPAAGCATAQAFTAPVNTGVPSGLDLNRAGAGREVPDLAAPLAGMLGEGAA